MVDVTVIGGGIVGLAVALQLLRRLPRLKVAVVEKEGRLGFHQTGHNSGVIHSGLYYRPGSLKARLCVAGAKALIAFCQEHGIPYRLCGKVIVATDSAEVPLLDTLYHRGVANGLSGLSLIGPERLQELEPYAQGIRALHVPYAGVVNFQAVAHAYAKRIEGRGGVIRTSACVTRLVRTRGSWRVETTGGDIESRYLVNCAGLHADRIARMTKGPSDLLIVPFRGEYYELIPSRRDLVRGMIYPVPDPAMPFLGVHLTRTIDDRIEAGPNAVLAWKREGYRKRDLSVRDLGEMLLFPGFWRMTRRHWKRGLIESSRALSHGAFVRAIRRLVPSVGVSDVVQGSSGVRAQAVNLHGELLDDFDLVQSDSAIHVRNAPSPAATASLSIGELIAETVRSAFSLRN